LDSSYYQRGEERSRIVSKLHSLLARYMLRRTKDEVKLSLPPKVEALLYTPLTAQQVRLLRALDGGPGALVAEVRRMGWVPSARLEELTANPFLHSAAAAAAGPGAPAAAAAPAAVRACSGAGSSSGRARSLRSARSAEQAAEDGDWATAGLGFTTVNRTMELRKVCVHPFWIAEPPLEPGTFTDDRIVSSCGKMVVLDKMLRRLKAGGHKVLIFSQFTTVLAILEDYLRHVSEAEEAAGRGGWGYRVLHGGTKEEDRDAAIVDFNAETGNGRVFAFLLSTKAGGQGINLVAADTVIFYDSDWNPQNDVQAMDRAHRIGQTRPVVVYRLCTEGASVERRMVRRAAAKGSLARMVLQEGRHRFAGTGAGAGAGAEGEDGAAAVVVDEPATGAGGGLAAASGSAAGNSDTAVASSPAEAGDDLALEPAEAAGGVVAAGKLTRQASAGGGSVGGYGLVSPELLRYWLREDVSDRAIVTGGISDAELDVVLTRDRALQAGTRVAAEVEAELLAAEHRQQGATPALAGVSAATATTASSSSSSSSSSAAAAPFDAPSGVAAAGALDTTKALLSGRKRQSSSPVGAALPVDASVRASAAMSAPLAAAANVPAAASHIAPPASARAPTSVLLAAEAQQVNWAAVAVAAPFTPSRGAGYEFVYHSAAQGIVPSTARSTAAATHEAVAIVGPADASCEHATGPGVPQATPSAAVIMPSKGTDSGAAEQGDRGGRAKRARR